MSAHTVGPWVSIEVKGRTIISSQAGDRVGECESLSKQDARLIEAAPDLLEALKEIAAGAAYRLTKGPDEGDSNTLRLALAAIKKVEGA